MCIYESISSIVPANIPEHIVQSAVTSLIENYSKEYFKAIKELREQSASDLAYLGKSQYYSSKVTGGGLYVDLRGKNDPAVPVFNVRTDHVISDEFRELLSLLRQRIQSLGYLALWAPQVFFDKGLLYPIAPTFHRDLFAESITICFSNREDFSTKVITLENENLLEYPIQKINPLAQSVLGKIVNAAKVLHRSPIPEDLKGDIKPEDWRLLIRFI